MHANPAPLITDPPTPRSSSLDTGPGPTPALTCLHPEWSPCLGLTLGHLRVLLAMALSGEKASQSALSQLRVLDLLSHELSIEHDVLHAPAPAPVMGREFRAAEAIASCLGRGKKEGGAGGRGRRGGRRGKKDSVVVKTKDGPARVPMLRLPMPTGMQSVGEQPPRRVSGGLVFVCQWWLAVLSCLPGLARSDIFYAHVCLSYPLLPVFHACASPPAPSRPTPPHHSSVAFTP